jgi:hypothetical protein
MTVVMVTMMVDSSVCWHHRSSQNNEGNGGKK